MLNIEYAQPIRNQFSKNGLECLFGRYVYLEDSNSWIPNLTMPMLFEKVGLTNVNKNIKTAKEAIAHIKENRPSLFKGAQFVFRSEGTNDLYITI